MLSIASLSAAAAAKSYYDADNYYTKADGQSPSHWHGTGASNLGLVGPVNAHTFEQVLEGNLPNGTKLGRVIKGERVHAPGTDLTFSAPKSVSILALVDDRKALIEAHQKAVSAALDWIEKEVVTSRIFDKAERQQVKTATGNLVAALFLHDTSRALDPQLHTHAVIANASQGPDGKWRSIQEMPLFQNKMLIGQMYRNELAANLAELGYAVEKSGKNGEFEITGVDKSIREMFSKRSIEVREAASLFGTSSPADLDRAALMTRASKQHVDREKLLSNWQQQMAEKDLSLRSLPSPGKSLKPAKAADEVLKQAMSHISERNAAFLPKDLLKEAMRLSIGSHRYGELEQAMNVMLERGDLAKGEIGNQHYLTTPAMLELERSTLEKMEEGKGASKPIVLPHHVDRYLQDKTLTKGQQAALHTSIETLDRTIGIQGFAGAGKTTLLKEVKALSEMAGREVIGYAPSGLAADNLQSESGIPSTTLQTLLTKFKGLTAGRTMSDNAYKVERERWSNRVVVVDEASFASSKQMNDLLHIANDLQFGRLILVGDYKQLDGVNAGKPFYQLQSGGMTTEHMPENMRQQRDQHREAVEAIKDGDVATAIKHLSGDIQETSWDNLTRETAQAWLDLPDSDRDHALIIAPTHSHRRAITDYARGQLVKEGSLGEKAVEHPILRPVNLTTEERTLASSYQAGQIVQFTKNYKSIGIEAGDYLAVEKVNDRSGTVMLEKGGDIIAWHPSRLAARTDGATALYDQDRIDLRQNDLIRFTRSDKDRDLFNSQTATILSVNERDVSFQMKDGRKITLPRNDPAMQHIDFGLAATIHAAQGQTVDHVIALADSRSAFSANQKMFYVTISRSRHGVTLFTDDADRLQRNLEANTGERLSAMEVHKAQEQEIAPVPDQVPSLEHEKQEHKHEPEYELERVIEKTIDFELEL